MSLGIFSLFLTDVEASACQQQMRTLKQKAHIRTVSMIATSSARSVLYLRGITSKETKWMLVNTNIQKNEKKKTQKKKVTVTVLYAPHTLEIFMLILDCNL